MIAWVLISLGYMWNVFISAKNSTELIELKEKLFKESANHNVTFDSVYFVSSELYPNQIPDESSENDLL